ncbi:DUF475 domain-containing protein [Micromonospora sp. RV43]|uniref:DUF475 domain-containing protein n=1 Tax=Micromonospora sp. RV43 TaxID=1661387 RepID=UPI00064C0245|nr:DUF475 domain-containing protein [Micromonospora sp. RV43]
MSSTVLDTPGTTAQPAKVSLIRIYWFSALVTLVAWGAVAFGAGPAAMFTAIVLTALEITFSFDNAVVNSKLVTRLSPFWQKLFLTVGIFVAVFVVRFVLPIVIVQLAAGLGFVEVIDLAVSHPEEYAHHLEKAGPMIDAFGGTFLLMIGIAYFMDAEKDVHWIGWLERRLAPLGRFDNLTIFVMVLAAIAAYFTVGGTLEQRSMVLAAAIMGIALHVGLDLFGTAFEGGEDGKAKMTVLVGGAAAVMFLRLEVLDASFSFDGVIGAFAITTSVLVIMAGLGAGAMFVRSMTVHLVRAGTLGKYRYLEHGAHWAILFLGVVMLLKLYGVHPPEWVTGSLGLVFIGLSVATSVRQRRKADRAAVAA